MNAFISKCIEANKEIYDYINLNLKPEDFLYHGDVGEGGDKSLNIDLITESIFIKHLSSFGNIYSEESGLIRTKNKNQTNIRIVIDPLDGSDNFLSNLPYYGTAVSFEIDNFVKIGIVCNLVSGLMYIRNEDRKLYIYNFDGEIISDSEYKNVNPKIGIFERSYSYPSICETLSTNRLKYRSPGAVALSLAWARHYNFVLFFGNLREFDLNAALYICSDLHVHQSHNFILVSGNKEIFDILKNLLKNIRL